MESDDPKAQSAPVRITACNFPTTIVNKYFSYDKALLWVIYCQWIWVDWWIVPEQAKFVSILQSLPSLYRQIRTLYTLKQCDIDAIIKLINKVNLLYEYYNRYLLDRYLITEVKLVKGDCHTTVCSRTIL